MTGRSTGTSLLALALSVVSLASASAADLDAALAAVEPRVIEWRRDIHQHPELSNREFRTAALVAAHLRELGMGVQEGVAHTGVVGTLVGALPGPVVALRADMDALPVVEQTGLPFASQAVAEYNGEQVGVMHACGHDAHVAMLMGAAEVLAAQREQLAGAVKFVFQPAEEGPPVGEDGGAKMMVAQGVLDEPHAPEAIFALHVFPLESGTLYHRARGAMAAADWLSIKVRGRQTHGASPWLGVDPITVAAQIVTALQAIPSRQLDVTNAPAVVTIGSIQGGVRGNIIPDEVVMEGTIRTFDRDMQADLHERIRRTAQNIAVAAGAVAEVTIRHAAPVTFNDPELARRMVPALHWAAGADKVREFRPITGAEDFAYYQERIPGLMVGLGAKPAAYGPDEPAPSNHSPLFDVNEDALLVGVRTLVAFALMYGDGEL